MPESYLEPSGGLAVHTLTITRPLAVCSGKELHDRSLAPLLVSLLQGSLMLGSFSASRYQLLGGWRKTCIRLHSFHEAVGFQKGNLSVSRVPLEWKECSTGTFCHLTCPVSSCMEQQHTFSKCIAKCSLHWSQVAKNSVKFWGNILPCGI